MRFLPLLWAGLTRKKLRTIFTLLSIAVAFVLFGLLQGINAAFSNVLEEQKANRLYVLSRVSMIEPLPSSYRSQIAAVPGVSGVVVTDFFGGYYQEPRNQIQSMAVDIDDFFALFTELHADPAQIATMKATRTGAMIGAGLAKKYGWKVGDRIPISSFIYPRQGGSREWPLDVVGIFQSDRIGYDSMLVLNHDYFDEARTFSRGMVGYYVVGIADPEHSLEVGAAIDKMYLNSPNETRTQTERELAQTQIKQIGDVNFLVNSIVGAVFFTLLFLTGNTMIQAFRERVPEFAVLKTLGFSNAGVAALVLGEAVVLCVIAAMVGLVGGALLYRVVSNVLPLGHMAPAVYIAGLGAAILLALVSGLPPAWRAGRLDIIAGLRV